MGRRTYTGFGLADVSRSTFLRMTDPLGGSPKRSVSILLGKALLEEAPSVSVPGNPREPTTFCRSRIMALQKFRNLLIGVRFPRAAYEVE